MSPIWNRKRSEMIQLKNTRSYLLYALGEIILVVVGILIALQVNNWKEEQKLEDKELEILIGIREELLKDTVDLNLNIRTYENRIVEDSLLLDILSRGKKAPPDLVNWLMSYTLRDTYLLSQQSYYSQLKQEGIGLIQNRAIRNAMSKFYDFDLKLMLMVENENSFFTQNTELKRQIKEYLTYESGEAVVSKKDYKLLVKDKALHYKMFEHLSLEKSALYAGYLPLKTDLLELIDQIEKELNARGIDLNVAAEPMNKNEKS